MMTDDKKLERKRKKFAAHVKSTKGIICTDSPTNCLILCNAGQATGLEKDVILKLISANELVIEPPQFIAEKGESHSFLTFKSNEDASLFFKACNGKAKIDVRGSPLYLNYVEKAPNTEIICHHANPKGLALLEDFITVDEEKLFFKLFDWKESESNLKNRQVKHYGYEFRYGTNDVDLDNPLIEGIPNDCDVLWERLKQFGIIVGRPDQLTINKYMPGQGIPSHVDKHSPFGPTILSLSLGSQVVMDWRHHTGIHVPIVIQSRSMLVMQGEARYDWQHGIHPRTNDPIIENRTMAIDNTEKSVRVITNSIMARGTRISLTFRWTRSGPCECIYKTLCDSAEITSTDSIEDKMAAALEDLHVHKVYDQIAGHFSTTRHKPWPRVVEFMSKVDLGSVVVDLGAGNGKNVLHRSDIFQLAGERCGALLAECALSGAQCVQLDLLLAPLRDRCADRVLCIAVVHHFTTHTRRLHAISTIARILRPGGKALITVWAKDQKKSNYLAKNKSQENQHIHSIQGLKLPVHENRTQFKHSDLLVPWKLRKNDNQKFDEPSDTLLRYYHVFEDDELCQLCCQVPSLIVEDYFFDEGNWCVVCKKI